MPFVLLGEDVILTVADKFLTELQSQLDERQVVIEVDEEARLWLVEKGDDATMGARPMERVIQSTMCRWLIWYCLDHWQRGVSRWSPWHRTALAC